MRRMLAAEADRLFTSKGFYGSILCTFAVYLLSSAEEMRLMGDMGSVCYFFEATNNFNSMMDILLILPVLPFALSFCSDWNNRYYRAVLTRTSPGRYCAAKMIVCYLSAFIAMTVGMLLYVGYLRILYPMTDPDYYNMADIFSAFSNEGHHLTGILLKCLIRGSYAGLWAMGALAVSSYIPDPLVTLISPLILQRAVTMVSEVLFSFNANYRPDYLAEGLVNMGSWQMSLLVPCGVFALLAAAAAWLFYHHTKKVLANA